MLSVKNITKAYPNQNVLNGVTFFLNPGQKAAIVGANGSGKSTLLRIIAGLESSDSGKVKTDFSERLGYMPQEITLEKTELTVRQYLKETAGISALEEKLQELSSDLNDPIKAEEYNDVLQQFIDIDGYNFNHTMSKIMAGLGFCSGDADKVISKLSGGQRSKVALVGTLLQGSDVLLLDEPTNNLDLPSILWLEKFLSLSKAIVLIVSHDRRFLDGIITKVFEIEWFKRELIEYTGDYSNYVQGKLSKIMSDQEKYEKQQEEIERLQKSARQSKNWSTSGSRQNTRDNDKFIRGARRDRSSKMAAQASSLEKQISNIKVIEPMRRREPTIIPIIPRQSEANVAISLDNVIAGYPENFTLDSFSINVKFGERIGFVGRNGTGKSTLLQTIAGNLNPVSGKVKVSPSVVFGSLTQTHEEMPRDTSVIDFLRDGSSAETAELFHILANFNFIPETVEEKNIGDLSPGERARVAMALFALNSANVLLLDEPTNHLDVDALDALEKVLATYKGTVIFISHDRYFLETVRANRLFLIEERHVGELLNIESYVDNLESITLQE